jgi:hypothetical protein
VHIHGAGCVRASLLSMLCSYGRAISGGAQKRCHRAEGAKVEPGPCLPCSAEDGASTSQVDCIDTLIHCAFPSLSMALRPLLRQVSSMMLLHMASINVLQRAVVPAMAATITAGFAFAPRIADAEEQQGDLKVRHQ